MLQLYHILIIGLISKVKSRKCKVRVNLRANLIRLEAAATVFLLILLYSFNWSRVAMQYYLLQVYSIVIHNFKVILHL